MRRPPVKPPLPREGGMSPLARTTTTETETETPPTRCVTPESSRGGARTEVVGTLDVHVGARLPGELLEGKLPSPTGAPLPTKEDFAPFDDDDAPAPPPPSLDVNPITSSTPGSAARRCAAHRSAARRGTASTLFNTSTSGFRSRRATCAYSAGGMCSIGCRASTTRTATSARSRTRHSWRQTSMFCSNAGACPAPLSMSDCFTLAIHRTNAFLSRECRRPRLSS
mmetsp:Transcript_4325/g.15234  ORF Transcript_4325/g.15234 Transcript_4325/m.15234 type:complete len:225 (-) Transcript_4325:494-1168(-)